MATLRANGTERARWTIANSDGSVVTTYVLMTKVTVKGATRAVFLRKGSHGTFKVAFGGPATYPKSRGTELGVAQLLVVRMEGFLRNNYPNARITREGEI